MEAFQKISEFRTRLAQRREKETLLKQGMEMFKIEKPPQNDLKEVGLELELLQKIWDLVDKWKKQSDDWKTCQLKTFNKEVVSDEVEGFRKEVLKMRKDLERREVWVKLREEVDLFKRVLPVMDDLLIPAIRPRHWEQLKVHLDEHFDPEGPQFCLKVLLDLHIEKQGEFVSKPVHSCPTRNED